jgi:tRNA(fMet)-specific endonuclease VapC
MLQFLFDTDHLTLFDHKHQAVLHRHLAQPTGAVGISAVTVQEYLRGRLAAIARHRRGSKHVQSFQRLVDSVLLLQHFPIVNYDQGADAAYQKLLAMRLRIGTQDMKIAAVALVNGLTLLTRNRRDFSLVSGLTLDDWSV